MSSLEDFFQALRTERPFSSNRVSDPSLHDVDVRNINAKEFERLTRLAGDALRGYKKKDRNGIGAMLLGGAGVGKSHLLSRFYRWAQQRDEGGQDRAVYVYLHNVLADPEQLPRYLLRNVISQLSEGRSGFYEETLLYRLLRDAVRHGLDVRGYRAEPGRLPPLEEIIAALETVNTRGGDRQQRDQLAVMLRVYVNLLHARTEGESQAELVEAGLDWLSGDPIEPAMAEKLGIRRMAADESVMLLDDDHLEKVFLLLTEIAAVAGRPFILCVDQVDNLSEDKVRALTEFLHKLLDDARNLLIVTSGVRETMLRFRETGLIKLSTWDRIAEEELDLRLALTADAYKIIESRVKRFRRSYNEVPQVENAVARDPLFPLTGQWWKRKVNDVPELKPRQAISWAKDSWQQELEKLEAQGDSHWLSAWPTDEAVVAPPVESLEAVIDRKIETKIDESMGQRRLHRGSLPADGGNLRALLEELLVHCQGRSPYTLVSFDRPRLPHGRKYAAHDLVVEELRPEDGAKVRSGVLFLVTRDGSFTYHALKRLVDSGDQVQRQILVTDEERRPLRRTPGAGKLYEELKRRGEDRFRHITLNFDEYAYLDALVGVVGQARVGDLEVEYPRSTFRSVTEGEVIEALHRQDVFRRHPLLQEFVTEEMPGSSESALCLDENEVRALILDRLGRRGPLSSRQVAYILAMHDEGLQQVIPEVQRAVNAIATRMHNEGEILASAVEDVLRLELVGQDTVEEV